MWKKRKERRKSPFDIRYDQRVVKLPLLRLGSALNSALRDGPTDHSRRADRRSETYHHVGEVYARLIGRHFAADRRYIGRYVGLFITLRRNTRRVLPSRAEFPRRPASRKPLSFPCPIPAYFIALNLRADALKSLRSMKILLDYTGGPSLPLPPRTICVKNSRSANVRRTARAVSLLSFRRASRVRATTYITSVTFVSSSFVQTYHIFREAKRYSVAGISSSAIFASNERCSPNLGFVSRAYR